MTVQIDWRNPLTRGLVAAYAFNNGGLPRDILGRHNATADVGTPYLDTTPEGLAHYFSGTNDDYSVPHSVDLDASGDFTVCVGVTPGSASSNSEIIEKFMGPEELFAVTDREK